LRKTLEKYYQRSGLGDPIRLQIPKKYVAVINRMTLAEVPEPIVAEPLDVNASSVSSD